MTFDALDSSINFSFAGCGFLGIYHVGVASALREYAPDLVVDKITGASAGAIAACSLICNVSLGQATSDVLDIVIQGRQRALGPLHPSFDLMEIVRQGLRRNLPDNAHKLASGRLFVSLTRFCDGHNVLMSQFDSKDELIQALICSAFIPFYAGLVPPMLRGVRYIDGGWSDNLPRLNGNTVTVSPFSGESDICPLDSDSQSFLSFDLRNTNVRFTARNLFRLSVILFPPHPEIMSQVCREGFEDALRFLTRHNLISCARCLEVKSSIFLASPNATAEDIAAEAKGATGGGRGGTNGVKRVTFEECAESKSASHAHEPHQQTFRSLSKLIDSSAQVNCESCVTTKHIASRVGLPSVVKQTLADAEAVERTFLNYLMEIRPIKWLWYVTMPWILPWDLAYAVLSKFLRWIPFVRKDGLWIVSKTTDALNFILQKMDEHRRQANNRLTCHMSITDLNYSLLPQPTLDSQVTPSGSEKSGHFNYRPQPNIRRRSSLAAGSVHSVGAGQFTLTGLNLGFGTNVSTSSALRQVKHMIVKEQSTDREFSATEVTKAAEKLELEGLQQATKSLGSATASLAGGSTSSATTLGGDPLQENFDTYANVLNFTRKRDAIMAYYYMDENKQLKVTKIFGYAAPDTPPLAGFCQTPRKFSVPNSTPNVNKLHQTLPRRAGKAVAMVAPFPKEPPPLTEHPESPVIGRNLRRMSYSYTPGR